MVSVCLPSDAPLQYLPSYLSFSYLGRGEYLHSCSSKAQLLLITLDEGYLLTATLRDLQCGITPLGPPVLVQPPLLGCGVAPPGRRPWPQKLDSSFWLHPWPQKLDGSSRLPPLASDIGWLLSVVPPRPQTWGSSSWPPPLGNGVLPASAPDLGCGVAPLTTL